MPSSQTPPRKPRGRPSTSRSGGDSAPTSILKAAVDEFGMHGFEGANITNIAERAQVAKPLVHYHFKTKDKLWYAAISHAMNDLQSDMGKLIFEIRGMDPVEAFKIAIKRYAYFCARNPNVARMLVSEVVRDTDRARWAQAEYQGPAYQLFNALQDEAARSGRFKNIPPYHFLPMINGAINAFAADRAILKTLYDIDTDDPKVIEQHLEIIIDALLNGLLATT